MAGRCSEGGFQSYPGCRGESCGEVQAGVSLPAAYACCPTGLEPFGLRTFSRIGAKSIRLWLQFHPSPGTDIRRSNAFYLASGGSDSGRGSLRTVGYDWLGCSLWQGFRPPCMRCRPSDLILAESRPVADSEQSASAELGLTPSVSARKIEKRTEPDRARAPGRASAGDRG